MNNLAGQALKTADAPDRLTDKARRILALSSTLLATALQMNASLWPKSENEGKPLVPPEPNALPWMLEAIEGNLNEARTVLESIESRL